ncbi:hypothetical protein RRF57_008644 [Xylaria bambusicola]|uniref:Uncharacterized protein n=1 Tax=Xylaria bambusicola TaxID=326684 RepID=A0AAN7Z0W3_9PEZI
MNGTLHSLLFSFKLPKLHHITIGAAFFDGTSLAICGEGISACWSKDAVEAALLVIGLAINNSCTMLTAASKWIIFFYSITMSKLVDLSTGRRVLAN